MHERFDAFSARLFYDVVPCDDDGLCHRLRWWLTFRSDLTFGLVLLYSTIRLISQHFTARAKNTIGNLQNNIKLVSGL